MSNQNPIVWINVTTSANWQRPPVGIVRVEQSLSAELAELYGSDFKYCVWDNNKFVEFIPNEQKNSNIEKKKLEVKNDQPKLEPIFPILPRRKALVVLAQAVLSLTCFRISILLIILIILFSHRVRVVDMLLTL